MSADQTHPRCGCGGQAQYNCSPDGAHWIECCKCGLSTGVGEDGAHAWELWGRALGSTALADLRERCAAVAAEKAKVCDQKSATNLADGLMDDGIELAGKAFLCGVIAAEIRALPLAPGACGPDGKGARG